MKLAYTLAQLKNDDGRGGLIRRKLDAFETREVIQVNAGTMMSPELMTDDWAHSYWDRLPAMAESYMPGRSAANVPDDALLYWDFEPKGEDGPIGLGDLWHGEGDEARWSWFVSGSLRRLKEAFPRFKWTMWGVPARTAPPRVYLGALQCTRLLARGFFDEMQWLAPSFYLHYRLGERGLARCSAEDLANRQISAITACRNVAARIGLTDDDVVPFYGFRHYGPDGWPWYFQFVPKNENDIVLGSFWSLGVHTVCMWEGIRQLSSVEGTGDHVERVWLPAHGRYFEKKAAIQSGTATATAVSLG